MFVIALADSLLYPSLMVHLRVVDLTLVIELCVCVNPELD